MSLIKDQIKNRQKYNRVLIEELTLLVEENPTQRLGQILFNYFYSNYDSLEAMQLKNAIYNEEPAKTLANIMKVKFGKG